MLTVIVTWYVTGAVYRHYESRRRIYNDQQPSREAARLENERKTKIRNRQRQVHILGC